MSMHPKSLLQLGAALLLAVTVLLPVRIGFADSFIKENSATTTIEAEACCDVGSVQACAEPEKNAFVEACPPHCAQTYIAKQPRAGMPAPATLAYAGASCTGCAAFSSPAMRLGTAPPARSNTPLIYFLQRLLI